MTFENRFGRFEKLLHAVSFHTRFSQVMLSDLEDALYTDGINSVDPEPVFVTGLPRSGTTILLTLLVRSGHFASHTYEDMPFPLCPLLWNKFSRHFARDMGSRERAHGDGIEVTGKSPEAFEEILWKQFWPDHYRTDRIEPWSASDANQEFSEFFRRHMAKIILVRQEDRATALRYVSKNNANIARLGVPSLPLHTGIVIVPFRRPSQHAASLLHQHLRFSALHTEDRFARRYMEELGHHEFGFSLKPIDFDGWLGDGEDPCRLEFWLRYWCAAYQAILARKDTSSHLVSYDSLVSNPSRVLARLADTLRVPRRDLLRMSRALERPRTHQTPPHKVTPAIRTLAREVHFELERAAITP